MMLRLITFATRRYVLFHDKRYACARRASDNMRYALLPRSRARYIARRYAHEARCRCLLRRDGSARARHAAARARADDDFRRYERGCRLRMRSARCLPLRRAMRLLMRDMP